MNTHERREDPRHSPRSRAASAAMTVAALLALAGCDATPAPPRVPIPATSNRDAIRDRDYAKPLAPEDDRIDLRVDRREVEPPPHNGTATATPPPPPASSGTPDNAPPPPPPPASGTAAMPDDAAAAKVRKDFVDAYRQVGQPHFVVLVNRTLDGHLIADPNAPAEDHPPGRAPLAPGQYDAAAAQHAIDLNALESRLADEMSCNRQVIVIPQATVHDKLTDAQVHDLEAGKPQALAAVDQGLMADVLIQVQALPTKQAGSTTEFRLIAEVVNVRGGQVIGHAVADIDRPQDNDQLNGATQYISRKLMIDMLRAWTAPAPDDRRPDSSSPPPPRP